MSRSQVDAYFARWVDWLCECLSEEDNEEESSVAASWRRLCAERSLTLGEGVIGLLVFDALTLDVFENAMFLQDPSATMPARVAAHLDLVRRLPFASLRGKWAALEEWLKEARYPEVAAIQEVAGLDDVVADSDTLSSMAAIDKSLRRVYAAFVAKEGETALLLSKSCFCDVERLDVLSEDDEDEPEKAIDDSNARVSLASRRIRRLLVARGEELRGPRRDEWRRALRKTVLVRATHRATQNRLAIASFHGKSGGKATLEYVAALRDAAIDGLRPDETDAFVVAMDANCADGAVFSRGLRDAGFLHCCAPEVSTVCKRRTQFQPQLRKAGKLDVAHKDFVCCCSSSDNNVAPTKWAVGETSYHPALTRAADDPDRDLLPSLTWPFDHAAVVADIEFCQSV